MVPFFGGAPLNLPPGEAGRKEKNPGEKSSGTPGGGKKYPPWGGGMVFLFPSGLGNPQFLPPQGWGGKSFPPPPLFLKEGPRFFQYWDRPGGRPENNPFFGCPRGRGQKKNWTPLGGVPFILGGGDRLVPTPHGVWCCRPQPGGRRRPVFWVERDNNPEISFTAFTPAEGTELCSSRASPSMVAAFNTTQKRLRSFRTPTWFSYPFPGARI